VSKVVYTKVTPPAPTVIKPPPPVAPTTNVRNLPKMIQIGNVTAPAAPNTFDETGVEQFVLTDLAVKLANTVPRLTSDWASNALKLPIPLIEKIVWQLKDDQLVEILGTAGIMSYRYSTSQRGRDHANRLLEISGYVGPAPVSLDAYRAMLEWQFSQQNRIVFENVQRAISPLVLKKESVEVAALASSSGRSLFLFGPPGNGKTTLGRLLHQVIDGDLWIPHCIAIDSHVIRVYDEQVHERVDGFDTDVRIDQRWVRIKRPFIVSGGEMTIDELDLAYSQSLRFYEAPPHVKANGGTFLLDDFGRQQIDPTDLLNRWIIPLESQIDHLTLNTGQKIQIPFRLQLVVATNLAVSDVADPAFLRRMGYRLHLDRPDEARYSEIFFRYAASLGATAEATVLKSLLRRYQEEGRELRASEPRDLIERVKDICLLRRQPFVLSEENIALAWTAYFGDTTSRGGT
jgi:predicted ATPase with chaperone activity